MKRLFVFVVITVLMLSLMSPVYAAGASASVSGGSAKKGDTVSVKVNFKCDDIGAAGGTLSYDASVLEFKSGSGANGGGGSVKIALYASGGGESALSTTLKFKAVGEGNSSLKLSGGSVIEWTSEALHNVSASGSVTIASAEPEPTKEPVKTEESTKTQEPAKTAEPVKTKEPAKTAEPVKTKEPAKTAEPIKTKEPETSKEPSPSVSPSPSPAAAVTETIDGKTMTLVTDLTDIAVPDGFEKSITEYKDVETACANVNGIVLLCFTDGTDHFFYINDENGLLKYRDITQTADKKYMFSDAAVEAPKGFTETTLEVNGAEERAWVAEDDEQKGFYLLYLAELGGMAGFYQYDTEKETLQRYIERTIVEQVEVPVELIVERTPEPEAVSAPVQEEDDYALKLTQDQFLIAAAVVGGLLLIALILFIALLVKGARLRKLRAANTALDDVIGVIPQAEEAAEETIAEEAAEQPTADPEPAAEEPEAAETEAEEPEAPRKKSPRKKKHTPAH